MSAILEVDDLAVAFRGERARRFCPGYSAV